MRKLLQVRHFGVGLKCAAIRQADVATGAQARPALDRRLAAAAVDALQLGLDEPLVRQAPVITQLRAAAVGRMGRAVGIDATVQGQVETDVLVNPADLVDDVDI
ncbi:hypothetical protein D3C72_1192730 [compost metagenome]